MIIYLVPNEKKFIRVNCSIENTSLYVAFILLSFIWNTQLPFYKKKKKNRPHLFIFVKHICEYVYITRMPKVQTTKDNFRDQNQP